MNKTLTIMLLSSLLFAGVLLTGCDSRQDIVLDEAEIEGPVKIRIVREVQTGASDDYTLEVYDKEGRLRALLRCTGDLPEGTILMHDDGRTWMVKNGKRGFILLEKTPAGKEGLK